MGWRWVNRKFDAGGRIPGYGRPMPPRADIAIAATLAVLGGLEPTVFGSVEADPALAVPLTGLAMVPLAFRRVAPGPAAAGVLAVLAVQEFAAADPATGMAAFLAILLALATLAARTGLRDGAAWLVAALALLCLTVAADRGADAGDFTYAGTTALIAIGVGRALRVRELHSQASEQRAAAAERDAREAVEAERARLARELHDVVAHGLSVIHVQARVAAKLLEDDPAAARSALGAVEEIAHDALGDMRRMLELLRVDGESQRGPQPGVADLATLIDRTREAGLPLEFEIAGERRPLPPALDLAVFRVVQEALTNVLKHAGQVPTRVCLAFRPEAVVVEVVNDGGRPPDAPAPSGHGLLGMSERAGLFGGEVSAGPRPEGGFAVLARLPLGAA